MPTIIESYKSRVKIKEGCWEWNGSFLKFGYGRFVIDKKEYQAHRVSYELFNGPIPDGMCVLHRCDNPPCTNPKHLFLGTKNENRKDAVSKNRQAKGSKIASSKLTEIQVLEIRRLHLTGRTGKSIAETFNVTPQMISYIVNRKWWRSI